VAVSDLALVQPLPKEISDMVEALVGCVAGAVLVEETERMAKAACLSEIQLTKKTGYVDSMTSFNDPLYRNILAALPAGRKPSDYVVSLEIRATKPLKCCCG
ncbi:MAG: arsenite S-adenosylmethyltransferase, partial [Candidatus Hydrogenedentes bacterium]|nr:arsenite S-adenosylmethyltransferase [Candidatus Hydrogenedentota bacterium]